MLGRRPRTVTAPSNDSEALVPVFTPDPHGAALFAGVVNGTLGHLGGRPVIDRSSSGEAWHGWTAAPQAFRGALGVAGGRPVTPTSTRLDQAGGQSAPDPIQSIFEERMNARRFE